MSQQTIEHRGWMVAAAAAAAVTSGLLGAAVAAGTDDIESNPATLTTEEEGTDTPENPSGLEQTNSFGYIPEHETPLDTEPIGPEGGGIDDDPFELGGATVQLPAATTLTTPTG
ncbi:hypothetical protein C8K36_106195 [Rhodococcus sp. OK519]|uniref:hypothetical protein n=1 Tax=Rhodococcus sp. OK519 TaxID=2135729 RepID=UPI000D3CC8E6|nr:hypothetical protein C8K36_106195 [Rhodococcus sp. OK519]